MRRRFLGLIFCLCFFAVDSGSIAAAASIVYLPMDDRPVNLEYVVDTVTAGGAEIITPPMDLIPGRTRTADPEKIWQWVFATAPHVDSMVLSTDSLIYGGLVASRTHQLSPGILRDRVERFRELKEKHPSLRLYLFGTIMRTPRMSAGGTEPSYYEKIGPQIFRLTSLEDKLEVLGLTSEEKAELSALLAKLPPEFLADWRDRRAKNFAVNRRLQELCREEVFAFFLLGRDDSSPLSASHQEGRYLTKAAGNLAASRYLSIPGADNLGVSMVSKAMNDLLMRIPTVRILFAPGAGGSTVPTYEDRPLGETAVQHIAANGGIQFFSARKPDLILALHTPADGKTREANSPENVTTANQATIEFVRSLKTMKEEGLRIALGDVSFANGADNSLLPALKEAGLLPRLASYSGWNTAGNTIGFALGQAMLTTEASEQDRLRLLAVRYLDDWAYQANIRTILVNEIVYPAGNSGQYLNELKPKLVEAAREKIRRFAKLNLWPMDTEKITVDFPWNRMFELGVRLP